MRGLMYGVFIGVATLLSAVGIARADQCHLSWDVPCCPVPGCEDLATADVILTICNCTDVVSDYEWFFPNDPFNAMPFQGVVTLEPGDCVDIPITIYCDPAAIGQELIFTVVVNNLTTGGTMKCNGSIRNTGDVKAVPGTPVVTVNDAQPLDLALTATNTSNKPVSWAPRAQVMPQGIFDVEPFEPIVLAPGESRSVAFKVNRLEVTRGATADSFFDIIYAWDQDGDGELEAGASTTLRVDRGACVADLNGDGRVGSGDLAILLAGWGACP